MELTFEALKSRKKPRTAEVKIALDVGVIETLERAVAKHRTAKMQLEALEAADAPKSTLINKKKAEVKESLREMEEAKALAEEEVVTFKFRSVGRDKVDDLIETHPPTADQKAKAKKAGADEPQWNVDTFPPALIAMTLQEPKFTEEEVAEIWSSDDWNEAEVMALFTTAMQVLNNLKKVDFLGNV